MDVNNPLKMVSVGIDPYPFSQTKGSLHRAGKLAAAKTPLDSDRRAKVDEQLLVQA